MARWSKFFKGFNPARTALQAGTQAVEKLSSDTSLQTFIIAGDSGDSEVEVDSEGGETLTIAGGTNITTAEVGRTVTIDASSLGDVVGPASVTDNSTALFDGTTGKLLKEGTYYTGDVVGPGSVTDNTVALFDGTTGKLLKEGAEQTSGNVVGPGSATDTAMCVYDDASGKLIGVGTITDDGVTVILTGVDVRAPSLPTADVGLILGQLYTDGTPSSGSPKHLMVSGGL